MWVKLSRSLFQYFIKMLCICAPNKMQFLGLKQELSIHELAILVSVSEKKNTGELVYLIVKATTTGLPSCNSCTN